ncbi:MAG: acyl carrier protein [Clostridia bacterium]|nr:acyl carrier protein [Clostridia bacterium]
MIQTLNILKPILADIFAVEEEEITPAVLFSEDLCADELDMTEIFMAVEEEFDVLVDPQDYDKILTVGDLIAYIKGNGND